MHVDPAIVEDEVRPARLERVLHSLAAGLQIGFVAEAGGQADIVIGHRLQTRPVGLAMDREREDARLGGEEPRRAVALVDVEIDHQRARDHALGQQEVRGHRDIVEHAEPRPARAVGMMAAAGGIGRRAVFEREAGGKDRSGHRAARAHRDGRRHLETDAPLARRLHARVEDLMDIVPVMGELEPARRGGDRTVEAVLAGHQPVRDQPVGDRPELAHGKAVRRRHVARHIGVVEDDGKRHRRPVRPACR